MRDPRGTFITLSHFCPTAASQLFREDVPLAIVESPASFPPADYDGLTVTGDDLPPLLRPDGVLVAWKGARDQAEEDSGAAAAEKVGMAVKEVIPVQPYPASENRHLHVYRKIAPTPAAFPRRAGMARKRPLA